jgi:uncharacterized protein DUF4142
MDRLSAMSGTAFDVAYMQHMVQDHKKTVTDFQKQAQSGSDPALKAFAQKYLPIIQQHLSVCRSECDQGLTRSSPPNPSGLGGLQLSMITQLWADCVFQASAVDLPDQ